MSEYAGDLEVVARSQDRRRRLRSDFLASREVLLNAVEVLLVRQGQWFSLIDLAKEAGMSTATAYRHFNDSDEVLNAYYERLIHGLTAEIQAVPAHLSAFVRFEMICSVWVKQALRWFGAAVQIRSASGYLLRVQAGSKLICELHETLLPVVNALIESGEIPSQTQDYAVLMWVTIFDERVIADLYQALGWSVNRITEELTDSAIAILRRRVGDIQT